MPSSCRIRLLYQLCQSAESPYMMSSLGTHGRSNFSGGGAHRRQEAPVGEGHEEAAASQHEAGRQDPPLAQLVPRLLPALLHLLPGRLLLLLRLSAAWHTPFVESQGLVESQSPLSERPMLTSWLPGRAFDLLPFSTARQATIQAHQLLIWGCRRPGELPPHVMPVASMRLCSMYYPALLQQDPRR